MGSFLGLTRVLSLCLLVSAAVAGSGGYGGSGGYQTKCQQPKVRREWRALADSEQAEFIRAVNCLADLPHDPRLTPSVATNVSLIPPVNQSSSFYDDLVYMHMDLNFNIHFTAYFLPWHRQYVQFFEDSLIEKCQFQGTMPYWDWTKDAADFEHSTFFDNSSHGVGGWGDPENDFQIYTGGFKDVIRAYPNPHHIRRNFTLFPFQMPPFPGAPLSSDPSAPPPPVDLMINTTFTQANVDYTVNNFTGDFIGFQEYTEGLNGIHPGAHLIVNADMIGYCPHGALPPTCYPGAKWTPNDPLFFLHHGMVDKVWVDWQNKDIRNKWAFAGGSVAAAYGLISTFLEFPNGEPPFVNFDSQIPGDGLWNITVWDVMDTLGDTLCYVYE